MATPPFNISTTTPGDSDIVSQFPANERTNRDQLNSWLLTEHNVNGFHNFLTLPVSGAPATPAAGFKRLYVDANGNLAFLDGAGLVYYIGDSPGTVKFTASASIPNGWVAANGQQIGRFSNGIALFAAIGTAYGAGDGSLTFNVPNINGRVIAGTNGGGILDATSGMNGVGIGSTGGVQMQPLAVGHLPPITSTNPTQAISVRSVETHVMRSSTTTIIDFPSTAGSGLRASDNTSSLIQLTSTDANNISVTSTGTTSTAHPNVQPTIVMTAIIKL